MSLDQLLKPSVEQWAAIGLYLLPAGHKEGYRWLAGSIHGEPGCSFDINFRTGFWGDWASDSEKGCGPISLWMAVKGVDFKTAIQQLSQFLGCQGDVIGTQHHRTETDEREKRILFPPGLSKPTERDLHILSWSRSIDIHALRIAAKRGFIYCFDDKLNGRCWIYTDQRRRCALRRRLDNQLFQLRNGSASKSPACHGSDMRTPIGYQEAAHYPYTGIAEGGPDCLAILAHAWAAGVQERIAPVCMPSSTANFTQSSLAYLQGKRARIFIDDNAPGQSAAERWAAQLQEADIVVDGFSFTGLLQADGQPVNDLNDLLKIDYDSWEQFRSHIENIVNFAL
jgi:hypothetical protein